MIDRFASLSEIKSTIFLKINIRWIVKETTENAYKTFQNYLIAKKKVGNRHHKYDGIWFKQQPKKILCGYSKTKCCIIQKQVSDGLHELNEVKQVNGVNIIVSKEFTSFCFKYNVFLWKKKVLVKLNTRLQYGEKLHQIYVSNDSKPNSLQ